MEGFVDPENYRLLFKIEHKDKMVGSPFLFPTKDPIRDSERAQAYINGAIGNENEGEQLIQLAPIQNGEFHIGCALPLSR